MARVCQAWQADRTALFSAEVLPCPAGCRTFAACCPCSQAVLFGCDAIGAVSPGGEVAKRIGGDDFADDHQSFQRLCDRSSPMGDQGRAGDLMRKSLCWTIVKSGSTDDRLGITMTAADGSKGRAGDEMRASGDEGQTGESRQEVGADDSDDAPLVLTSRLWPTFAARTVVLNPGSALPFAEADWSDALVVVESGELEVETISGLLRQFRAGEILWFAGLDLRVLRSCGAEPTVLKAVSRGRPD